MKKQKSQQEAILNGDVHKNFGIRIDHLFREKKKSLDQIIPELKKEISHMQECALIGNSEKPEYFDVFAEEKVLWLLMDLIRRTEGNKEIVIAVIETLNMLIINIQEEKNLSLILSGLPPFISMQYDFSQEEIIDYYINLLKILSKRISNEKYLILYFNQIYNYFPLLWESSRFFNRRDSLINTTSRNILLSVLESKKSEASQLCFNKYLRSLPFQIIITNYILDFKKCWLEASQYLYNQNKHQLLDQQEKIKDYLCFFHDLKRIQPAIKKLVDNALLEYAILPSILNGLLNGNKGDKVCITLGLNILYLLLENLDQDNDQQQGEYKLYETPTLKKVIIYLLTSPTFGLEPQNYQTSDPSWYEKEWKPKTFWDSKLDYLKQRCEYIFTQEQESKGQNNLINGVKQSLGQSISRIGSSIMRKSKSYIPQSLSEEIDDFEQKLGLVSDKQSFLEIIQEEIKNPISIKTPSSNTELYQGWFVQEKKVYSNPYLETIFLYLCVNQYFQFSIKGKDDTLLFSSLNLLEYLETKKFINIRSDKELSKKFYEELINIIKTPMPIQDETLQLTFKHLYRIKSEEKQDPHFQKQFLKMVFEATQSLRNDVCNETNYDVIYKEFISYYQSTQKNDLEKINIRFDFKSIFEHQAIGSDICEKELCRQKFRVFSQLLLFSKILGFDFQLFEILLPVETIIFSQEASFYECKAHKKNYQKSEIQQKNKNYLLTIKDDYLYLVQPSQSDTFQVSDSCKLNKIVIDHMNFLNDLNILFQDTQLELINPNEKCQKFKDYLTEGIKLNCQMVVTKIVTGIDNLLEKLDNLLKNFQK